MLILRPIEAGDLDSLVALAQQLDSMNLPAEPDFLQARIALSQRSFASELEDWREAIYLFVLEDSAELGYGDDGQTTGGKYRDVVG